MTLGLLFLSIFLLIVFADTVGWWIASMVPVLIVALMIWTDPKRKKKNDEDDMI